MKPSLAETTTEKGVSSIPGLHIIANFAVEDRSKTMLFAPFREFILQKIHEHHLLMVGDVFHDFEAGGFTAVLCLAESHLSIHTWPENQYVTFDVFLSNYQKDNRDITRLLYHDVREFFNATVLFQQVIER